MIAKRLLDQLKLRGFQFRRVATGVDGPLVVLIRDREVTLADLGRRSGLGGAQLATLLRELVRQHLVLVR